MQWTGLGCLCYYKDMACMLIKNVYFFLWEVLHMNMSLETLFLCVRDGTPYLKEIPARTLDSSTFPHTITNKNKSNFFLLYVCTPNATRSTITYRKIAYTKTMV